MSHRKGYRAAKHKSGRAKMAIRLCLMVPNTQLHSNGKQWDSAYCTQRRDNWPLDGAQWICTLEHSCPGLNTVP